MREMSIMLSRGAASAGAAPDAAETSDTAGAGKCPATGELEAICGADSAFGANMRAISGRATKKPIRSAVTERIATSMILNHAELSRPSGGAEGATAGPVSTLAKA